MTTSTVSGGFSGSGYYPVWSFCNEFADPGGKIDPTPISFELSVSATAVNAPGEPSLLEEGSWEASSSSSGSSFTVATYCGTTSAAGSVTWGSLFTCSDGSQGIDLAWSPTFEQTQYVIPYVPVEVNTAVFTVLVHICASGVVTAYISEGGTTYLDWASIADEILETGI